MIVVKIGGAAGIDMNFVCRDTAALRSEGQEVILVHGGSAETNEISEKMGHPPRFVTSVSGYSSRYTDRQTLEYFAMATRGKINTFLVESLQANGVNAIGLSGLDARIMVAQRKTALRIIENGRKRIIRDDYTGKIEEVNSDFLRSMISAGLTPVIAPMALSYENEALNVDADRAAASIAGALNADALILLSNVPGLLEDPQNPDSLVREVRPAQMERAMSLAEGRMKKKVMGAGEALGDGVQKVIFASGNEESPIRQALAGQGTVFHAV